MYKFFLQIFCTSFWKKLLDRLLKHVYKTLILLIVAIIFLNKKAYIFLLIIIKWTKKRPDQLCVTVELQMETTKKEEEKKLSPGVSNGPPSQMVDIFPL